MKIKGHLSGLVLLVAVLIFVYGCSSAIFPGGQGAEKEASETPDKTMESKSTDNPAASTGEGLIGSWINNEYNNKSRSAILVYENGSEGKLLYTAYDNTDGSGNSYKGTVEIIETWTDPEGRIIMKSIVTLTGEMIWETITRMSGDGTMIEVQSGTETINPDGPQYSKYYRE